MYDTVVFDVSGPDKVLWWNLWYRRPPVLPPVGPSQPGMGRHPNNKPQPAAASYFHNASQSLLVCGHLCLAVVDAWGGQSRGCMLAMDMSAPLGTRRHCDCRVLLMSSCKSSNFIAAAQPVRVRLGGVAYGNVALLHPNGRCCTLNESVLTTLIT